MAYIQNRGQSPDGSQPLIPVSGSVFTFQGAIPNGGNKSTGWFNTANYDSLGFVFRSNRSGQYTLEYSEDKSTLFVPMITVQYTDVNQRRKGAVDQDATWCRIIWYNNSGSDATLSMRVNQKTGNFQPSLETLGAIGADTRLAMWSKNTLHVTDNSGNYGDVTRTGTALNVNVTNPLSATDVSALAKDQTLTNGSQRVAIVDGNNQLRGTITNPLGVQVTNFPATQPVSGTVNIGNLPATQPVSGSVSVSNFPASQPVTGTFWPTVQPVSGTVATTLPVNVTIWRTTGAFFTFASLGTVNKIISGYDLFSPNAALFLFLYNKVLTAIPPNGDNTHIDRIRIPQATTIMAESINLGGFGTAISIAVSTTDNTFTAASSSQTVSGVLRGRAS